MELVPIITQILSIVAAIFILVLIVSFIASKMRKQDKPLSANKFSHKTMVNPNSNMNKHAYESHNFSKNPSMGINQRDSYPSEIKIVRNTNPSKVKYRTASHMELANSRFTVINKLEEHQIPKVETDEYGFKIYNNSEVTRSIYFPN